MTYKEYLEIISLLEAKALERQSAQIRYQAKLIRGVHTLDTPSAGKRLEQSQPEDQ